MEVEACESITGKDLFDSLKRMCAHSKSTLKAISFPTLVTNRVAHGYAALAFGTGPHDLCVDDCVPARDEDFDDYRLPVDDKLEPHQRSVTHMATWFKRARCEIQMFESIIGVEHGKERRDALAQLEAAHEKDPTEYPDHWVKALYFNGC